MAVDRHPVADCPGIPPVFARNLVVLLPSRMATRGPLRRRDNGREPFGTGVPRRRFHSVHAGGRRSRDFRPAGIPLPASRRPATRRRGSNRCRCGDVTSDPVRIRNRIPPRGRDAVSELEGAGIAGSVRMVRQGSRAMTVASSRCAGKFLFTMCSGVFPSDPGGHGREGASGTDSRRRGIHPRPRAEDPGPTDPQERIPAGLVDRDRSAFVRAIRSGDEKVEESETSAIDAVLREFFPARPCLHREPEDRGMLQFAGEWSNHPESGNVCHPRERVDGRPAPRHGRGGGGLDIRVRFALATDALQASDESHRRDMLFSRTTLGGMAASGVSSPSKGGGFPRRRSGRDLLSDPVAPAGCHAEDVERTGIRCPDSTFRSLEDGKQHQWMPGKANVLVPRHRRFAGKVRGHPEGNDWISTRKARACKTVPGEPMCPLSLREEFAPATQVMDTDATR